MQQQPCRVPTSCPASVYSNLKHITFFSGYIENGYVKLIVIHFQNSTEHLPLIGKVGLSWRTDVFDGCIKVRGCFFSLKCPGLCIRKMSVDVCV